MPQTERLFQEDSFCRRFTAQVVACEPYKSGWRAELSRTAFFPEGGGQPCDLGTLQPQNGPEAQVLDVLKKMQKAGKFEQVRCVEK